MSVQSGTPHIQISLDGRTLIAQADDSNDSSVEQSSAEESKEGTPESSGSMDQTTKQAVAIVDKLTLAHTAQQEIDQAIHLLASAGEKFNQLRDIGTEIDSLEQPQQANNNLEQLVANLRDIQDKLAPISEVNNDLDSILATLINGSPQQLIPLYNSVTELKNLVNEIQPNHGFKSVTQTPTKSDSDSSYDDSDSYNDDSEDVDQNGYE